DALPTSRVPGCDLPPLSLPYHGCCDRPPLLTSGRVARRGRRAGGGRHGCHRHHGGERPRGHRADRCHQPVHAGRAGRRSHDRVVAGPRAASAPGGPARDPVRGAVRPGALLTAVPGGRRRREGPPRAGAPAVLDVRLPELTNDDERVPFGDPRRLRRIGDLGRYLDTEDVADIEIDSASLTDDGLLRLHVAPTGESRVARLARVLTPRIVASVVPLPSRQPIDDVVFEPPLTYWGDNGSFFLEAAEFSDPIQGNVANCYLIAAMSAVAWAQPYRIRHMTRATGTGQQQFVNKVRLHDATSHAGTDVEITDAIPLKFSNNRPMYARSSEPGETWPSILEKAYAKWESGHTGDTPSIESTAWRSGSRACAELTGLTRWSVDTASSSADDLWSLVRQNSLSGRTFNPMTAGTYGSGESSPDKVVYADANLVAS